MARKNRKTSSNQDGEVQGSDLPLETDSIQDEFGDEYSEETLNIMRGLRKQPQQEQDESLDPVEDLEDYLEHDIRLPPKAYDALQQAGKEVIAELRQEQQERADPEVQQAVRYRQRLAQGTSVEDLKWLKLRAYYRAADELKAEKESMQAAERKQRMEDAQVPTDRVPAELLDMTPQQLEERRKLVALANAMAARKRKPTAADLLAMPSPSEESEWPAEVLAGKAATGPSPALLEAVSASLSAAITQLYGPAPGSSSQQGSGEPAASTSQAAAQKPKQRVLRTVYTEAYLKEQELQRRIKQQARQRTFAFWASFLTVTGVFVVRHIRNTLLRKKGAAGKKKGQAAAAAGKGAVHSDSVSVVSGL